MELTCETCLGRLRREVPSQPAAIRPYRSVRALTARKGPSSSDRGDRDQRHRAATRAVARHIAMRSGPPCAEAEATSAMRRGGPWLSGAWGATFIRASSRSARTACDLHVREDRYL